MDKNIAFKIAVLIISDLRGRSGGDHWYDTCDADVRHEIADTWANIIYKEVQANVQLRQTAIPKRN